MQFSAALKDGTKDLHVAAERTPFARSLIDGTVTRGAFHAHLKLFLAAHVALDAALARCHAALHGAVRPRLPAIAADLCTLAADEVAPPRRFLAAIDDIVALLETGDAATAVGATYVLEGSALGGAFLYPRVRAVGAIPEEALHHYRGHGEATFPIWMGIRAVLDATPLDDQANALEAARAVFAAMGRAYAALERLGEVREESGSYPVVGDRLESPLEKTGA